MRNKIGKLIYKYIVVKLFKYKPLFNVDLNEVIEFQNNEFYIKSITARRDFNEFELSFECTDKKSC